ncbi:MAG: hypothetical protein II797_03995, partial [Clostridia bacterium]|nr:hypothetical protein [Clostridia bacterium]
MENGDTEYIARSPWKERENLPKPSVLLTIIAMATTVLCSAFYAGAQTEFISLCLATASFAFLLVMDRRWYVLSAIPLSYLLALFLFTGGDGVRALFSL